MKVVVTGASGFIGGSLVRLLAKKHKVKAIVRKTSDVSKLPKGIELCYADITKKKNLLSYLKGVDIVYHSAAALPHHRLNNDEYKSINVGGTRNLLEAALEGKVKHFVHISTVGIYNVDVDSNPSEKTHPKPTDIYSKTKLLAEKEVLKTQSKGLKATIIRPTLVFGPYDTRPGFYNLFKLINKGMFIPMKDNNISFHTLYIDNLTNLLMKIALDKKSFNNDFIIGDYPCPTMDEFIDTIYDVSGRSKLPFSLPISVVKPLAWIASHTLELIGLPTPINSTRLNFITKPKKYNLDKSRKILGYNSRSTVKEAVKETYDWYIENELI